MEVPQDVRAVQTGPTTMAEAVAQAAQTVHTTMVEAAVQVAQTVHTTMAVAAVELAQPDAAMIVIPGVTLIVNLDVEADATMLVIVAIPCAAMALKELVQVAAHNAKRIAPRLVLMDVIDK